MPHDGCRTAERSGPVGRAQSPSRLMGFDRPMASPIRDPALERLDDAACRAAIRVGSRSFHAASLMLPAETRRDALALYAFCRVSDDLVDEPEASGSIPERPTARLIRRLDGAYGGDPDDHWADRAFARAVTKHAIPYAVPRALIEGFEWDEAERRYETIADLHAYGTRVAATVGVMMTLVMGCRDPHVLARACDLGLAMQLTNIARDVGEDARAGRIYLPLAWLREEGVEPSEFVGEPIHDERIARVVERLLAEAARLYRRAETGIGGLPSNCRPAIAAALGIYRDIGRDIARAEHDSVSRRARTTAGRKLLLAARAGGRRFRAPPMDRTPPMPQVRELIEAVEAAAIDPVRPRPGRAGRAIEILGALTERERADQRATV